MDKERWSAVNGFKLLDSLRIGVMLIAGAAGTLVPHSLEVADSPEQDELEDGEENVQKSSLSD